MVDDDGVRKAILELVDSAEEAGDTFVPPDDLARLPYERFMVREATRRMVRERIIVLDRGGEVYRRVTFEAEARCAVALCSLGGRAHVVVGAAGTGKTTQAREWATAYDGPIHLAAPTGKAAQRLGQALSRPAATVHRLLGLRQDGTCAHELDGLTIVDEAGMLDVAVAAALFSAVRPGARLLLLGDADQLPSVGPGSVLLALVESGSVPVTQLKKVFRQSEDGALLRRARALRAGRGWVPGDANDWRHMDVGGPEAVERAAELAAETRWPVLCPTRRLNGELNRKIQALVNPGTDGCPAPDRSFTYRVGDPVLFAQNDYGSRNVRNGQSAIVVETESEALVVETEDRRLTVQASELVPSDEEERPLLIPGYSMTCHKAQGSEWPHVILAVPHDSRALSREWLYTGVTRARGSVTIIGPTGVLKAAALRPVQRRHKLVTRIRDAARTCCVPLYLAHAVPN